MPLKHRVTVVDSVDAMIELARYGADERTSIMTEHCRDDYDDTDRGSHALKAIAAKLAAPRVLELVAFTQLISRMTSDGERTPEGVFTMGHDDAVATLNDLIAKARALAADITAEEE